MTNRDQRQRLIKALFAAAVAGACIRGLLHYLLLPALARGLTTAQLKWLRTAFETHPGLFLLAILVLAAALGLPVLLVALRTAHLGPWRDRRAARRQE
ncbi:MAG: hypothetical protein LAP39_00600 [Acidobacteriia bacterium]|nr:hypothetical protein [Terriglobia bacterium]